MERKINAESSKIMFKKTAWTKANNILKEILHGFYFYSPEDNLHKYEVTPNVNIKYHKYGTPLLRCTRDTNNLEGLHVYINHTMGFHIIGPELANAVLSEHRHRAIIKASEKNILDYPNIYH